jgi:hypothetical protein
MKRIFCLLLLVLGLSCSREKKFYDIEGPEINFAAPVNDEEVLIQFNEPVKTLSYQVNEKKESPVKEIKNDFPKSNVYISDPIFKDKKSKTLNIEAKDTAGNLSKKVIKAPVINTNPAALAISSLQLKYSKKKEQNFIIKAQSDGNLTGYSLVFFIRKDRIELDFAAEDIKNNDELMISFTPDKKNNLPKKEILFSEKFFNIAEKYRLSQDTSLIYLKNHKDEIIDYIFYYDLKDHTAEYYKNNKTFKKMYSEIKKYILKPEILDVSGNSVKKPVVRNIKKEILGNTDIIDG